MARGEIGLQPRSKGILRHPLRMLNRTLTRFLQRFFFSLHFSRSRKNLCDQDTLFPAQVKINKNFEHIKNLRVPWKQCLLEDNDLEQIDKELECLLAFKTFVWETRPLMKNWWKIPRESVIPWKTKNLRCNVVKSWTSPDVMYDTLGVSHLAYWKAPKGKVPQAFVLFYSFFTAEETSFKPNKA